MAFATAIDDGMNNGQPFVIALFIFLQQYSFALYNEDPTTSAPSSPTRIGRFMVVRLRQSRFGDVRPLESEGYSFGEQGNRDAANEE